MVTISQKRRRMAIAKWAALGVMGVLMFMPKVDQIDLSEIGVPFVSMAMAAE